MGAIGGKRGVMGQGGKALVLVFLFAFFTSALGTEGGVRAAERRDPSKDVVLVADPWCPFNCVPDSDREGYMVDIAREILEPRGYHIIYRTVNWARAIRGVQAGDWAGLIALTPTESPDLVFPETPLGATRTVLFTRADNPWRYTGPDSLDGKIVATVKGYDYPSNFSEVAAHARIDAQTGEDPLRFNFLKLWAGRVDFVLAEEQVARLLVDEMIARGEGEPVRSLNMLWPALPLYVAFSPARPESKHLAGLLDKGMIRLRNTDRLDEILARYGVEDWEQATASK